MAESGLPAVDITPLFGLIGPAGMLPPLVERIGMAASSGVRGPLKEKLEELGFIPVGSTPVEFKIRIEHEVTKWTRVTKDAGIQPNK